MRNRVLVLKILFKKKTVKSDNISFFTGKWVRTKNSIQPWYAQTGCGIFVFRKCVIIGSVKTVWNFARLSKYILYSKRLSQWVIAPRWATRDASVTPQHPQAISYYVSINIIILYYIFWSCTQGFFCFLTLLIDKIKTQRVDVPSLNPLYRMKF